MEELYNSPNYKEATTSRGYTYRYYWSPPLTPAKPTLLFVHGFASFSAHWMHQIKFFEAEGYGLVVPDMLGYGGTSCPLELEAYGYTLQARDLIDILDAEHLKTNVIAVGHGWGSSTVTRLGNLYQDRFLGFAFCLVGYMPPNTMFTYQQTREAWARASGYDQVGYWSFLASPRAPELLRQHAKSFWDMAWPKEPSVHSFIKPEGSLEKFLEWNGSAPRAKYISDADAKTTEALFAKRGWWGPLAHFRLEVTGAIREDGRKVPLQNYTIYRPVLFVEVSKHQEIIPDVVRMPNFRYCPNHTKKVLETGPWAFLEAPQEFNIALKQWVEARTLSHLFMIVDYPVVF
ncbi:alpha/beta-hydrolase [Coprinopsis marcescibilis]|uniref:Alpha/beta-hydrolase n=1 Tax=Coprinopsis marcescibilis TaxID=230819 RepID=A0A5C3KN42_COPMA|nr:alpha/beta-hydrolase [Coprinopsis marcescibilis]